MLKFYELENGQLDCLEADQYPGSVWAWNNGSLKLGKGATRFGFVLDGECRLSRSSGKFIIKGEMYFSFPGAGSVESSGRGIAVSRKDYAGVFHLGGPIESQGRLRYIDGCSDSLLIAPIMLGGPCLNLLHIPKFTKQSRHTHPMINRTFLSQTQPPSGKGRPAL